MPDLLFLDIQMPKLDGFEVLELIEPGPAVVFVTAYDQYAIRVSTRRKSSSRPSPISASGQKFSHPR
jgi:two-component system LytT family response regulator